MNPARTLIRRLLTWCGTWGSKPVYSGPFYPVSQIKPVVVQVVIGTHYLSHEIGLGNHLPIAKGLQ